MVGPSGTAGQTFEIVTHFDGGDLVVVCASPCPLPLTDTPSNTHVARFQASLPPAAKPRRINGRSPWCASSKRFR